MNHQSHLSRAMGFGLLMAVSAATPLHAWADKEHDGTFTITEMQVVR